MILVDRIHKLPIVRDLLCKIGRHDFEAERIDGKWAVLYCFYCGHQRKSWMLYRALDEDSGMTTPGREE